MKVNLKEIINEHRQVLGLTEEQYAKTVLKISRGHFSRVVNGRTPLSKKLASTLIEKLDGRYTYDDFYLTNS